jgi:hypothetical protein
MAGKLGYKIPSYRELQIEIKLQKDEFKTTFKRKKGKIGRKPQSSRFYQKKFTSDLMMNRKAESNKVSERFTKIENSTENQAPKEKINLISSEICDVVDDILHTSPIEKQHKPSYLRYVKNPVGPKSNDSETFNHHPSAKKLVNQTSAVDSEKFESCLDFQNFYKRGNTSDLGVGGKDDSKIDDSIVQAYQLIHNNRKKTKGCYIKQKYPAYNLKYRRNFMSKKIEEPRSGDKVLESAERKARAKIIMPPTKEAKKKSLKDKSSTSSANASQKSTKSVKEMLSPSNAQKRLESKQPSSASKAMKSNNSEHKNKKGVRKSTFDNAGGEIDEVKIDLMSMVDSTKESEGSGPQTSLIQVPKTNPMNQSLASTKIEPNEESKHDYKYVNTSDSDPFEENANEEEIDEALNYTDYQFEATEENYDSCTPLSTQGNEGYNSEMSEEEADHKYHADQIEKIAAEIEDRWKLLHKFADREIVKK